MSKPKKAPKQPTKCSCDEWAMVSDAYLCPFCKARAAAEIKPSAFWQRAFPLGKG